VTNGARVMARHHAERGSRLTKGGRVSVVTEFDAISSEGSMHPFASAPPAAPLPRRSEAETFWNSFSCDHSIAVLQSVPAFLLQTPGGRPAAPAQVARCRMLACRVWKRGPVAYRPVPVPYPRVRIRRLRLESCSGER
jgi:hypothetical protein